MAKSATWYCLSYCNSIASLSPQAKAGDDEDRLQSEGEGDLEGIEEALDNLERPKEGSLSLAEGERDRQST